MSLDLQSTLNLTKLIIFFLFERHNILVLNEKQWNWIWNPFINLKSFVC